MERPDTFCQAEEVSSADAIAPLSCADVIAQRSPPLVLFTPALLVTHGRFDRDPVIEFDARFPAPSRDTRPFYTELTRGAEFFFSGLGVAALRDQPRPVNWDKRLYCVDATRAEECFAFIGGIAFSDPKTGFFGNTFFYNLRIPDPTSRQNQTLDVTVFGVATNSALIFLTERINLPPQVVVLPVKSGAEAAQFLRGRGIVTSLDDTDPLNMRD